MDFDLKEFIFKKAKNLGFTDCEIFYYKSKNLSINVFKGEVEKFQNNSSAGLSFRGVFGGFMGYSFTEKLDEKSLEVLIESAKENAKIITEEKEELFAGSKSYSEVKTFYDEIEKIEVEDLIEKCLEIEKKTLGFSEEIKALNNCGISKSFSQMSIANTKGLDIENKANAIFSYVSALAQRDGSSKTFGEFNICYNFEEIDSDKIAKAVAKGALSYLGAGSLKSGVYKVVIENECFADLLQVFTPNFYAENVQRGFSLLKGRLGESIASSKLTILDEPLLEKGYASTSFDSEGVASFNKTVVENGILKTYLYNLKAAKKDGVQSTGNGFKNSYKGSTSTSATNFYLKKGDISFEDMLKEIGDGVLITSLSGLHSGTNSISGDFSLLAEGFLINSGKISAPVEQITISENFYNILKNISAISNDLKFNSSAFGSPSVFVGEVSIAGE